MSALDLEGQKAGKAVRGGQERFAFENDFLLKHLRRVLNENWRRLPEPIAAASQIEIEVKLVREGGHQARRHRPGPAEMFIGRQSWDLPYHACLSELLYGEPLYRQRRRSGDLPLPGSQRTRRWTPGCRRISDRSAGRRRGAGAAARRRRPGH